MLAPVVRGQKGEYKDLFEDAQRGFPAPALMVTVVKLTDDLKLTAVSSIT